MYMCIYFALYGSPTQWSHPVVEEHVCVGRGGGMENSLFVEAVTSNQT